MIFCKFVMRRSKLLSPFRIFLLFLLGILLYNKMTKKRVQVPIKAVSDLLESHPNRTSVIAAFRHAWKGYKEHAWGYDELLPVSKKGSNWFHLGLTIIDSLDTALIMEQDDIFKEAKEFVKEAWNKCLR